MKKNANNSAMDQNIIEASDECEFRPASTTVHDVIMIPNYFSSDQEDQVPQQSIPQPRFQNPKAVRASSHVRGGIPQANQRLHGDRISNIDNFLNTPSRTQYNVNSGPISASAKAQNKFKQSYVNSTNNRTPNYSVVGNANYLPSS
jgi:hypothetical protein